MVGGGRVVVVGGVVVVTALVVVTAELVVTWAVLDEGDGPPPEQLATARDKAIPTSKTPRR